MRWPHFMAFGEDRGGASTSGAGIVPASAEKPHGENPRRGDKASLHDQLETCLAVIAPGDVAVCRRCRRRGGGARGRTLAAGPSGGRAGTAVSVRRHAQRLVRWVASGIARRGALPSGLRLLFRASALFVGRGSR